MNMEEKDTKELVLGHKVIKYDPPERWVFNPPKFYIAKNKNPPMIMVQEPW